MMRTHMMKAAAGQATAVAIAIQLPSTINQYVMRAVRKDNQPYTALSNTVM